MKLGDVSNVSLARRLDPDYDRACSQAADAFWHFFSSVSSADIKVAETSDGMEASVLRVGGSHDVQVEEDFSALFQDTPHVARVTSDEDKVYYKLAFGPADQIVSPRKFQDYFNLLVGLVFMVSGLFAFYEVVHLVKD